MQTLSAVPEYLESLSPDPCGGANSAVVGLVVIGRLRAEQDRSGQKEDDSLPERLLGASTSEARCWLCVCGGSNGLPAIGLLSSASSLLTALFIGSSCASGSFSSAFFCASAFSAPSAMPTPSPFDSALSALPSKVASKRVAVSDVVDACRTSSAGALSCRSVVSGAWEGVSS